MCRTAIDEGSHQWADLVRDTHDASLPRAAPPRAFAGATSSGPSSTSKPHYLSAPTFEQRLTTSCTEW